MAIKLQILQDVRKSGGKLFYVRAFHEDHISTKELAKVVQDSCTAKTSDVLAIINEFHFVFNMLLRESMQVKIDELGTFRLNLTSSGAIAEELFEITRCLKSINVRFRPELAKRNGSSYASTKVRENYRGQYRLASPICDGVSFELHPFDVKMREKFKEASGQEKEAGWNKYMGRYTVKK